MSAAPVVAQGRREYKDEQILARLIGAAVLLVIAVIVLPFVLDGAGSQREYEFAETLPVEPERPVPEKSFSSRQPLPEAPAADEIPVVSTDAPPVFESSVAAPQGPDATEATVSAGESVNKLSVPVSRSQLQAQQIPSGFNIQVASFNREANARKLVERLQNENLPAFVNRVQGNSQPILRVFVGPISSQVDALALKNQIDRTYRVESILVTRK